MDEGAAVRALRAAGCVFAEEEAALIFVESDDPDSVVRRRCAGEPLEHLLGFTEFAGLRIATAPGVFVPRQRSTLLAQLAITATPEHGIALDLCCGTGGLGAAIRHARPTARVLGSDLDPDAVAIARSNLTEVHEGDLFTPLPAELRGRIDVIVCNAPYVPTREVDRMPREAREYEHRLALDGGDDGLEIHRRIAAELRHWLAAGGCHLVEVAPTQVDAMVATLTAVGLATEVTRDDERGGCVVSGTADSSLSHI